MPYIMLALSGLVLVFFFFALPTPLAGILKLTVSGLVGPEDYMICYKIEVGAPLVIS